MSILSELNTVLSGLSIPVETGVFSGIAPDEYCVLTPLADSFDLFGDDKPQIEVCEVRISLFRKENYLKRARQIVIALLVDDFTITSRRYIGYEDDTGYHLYSIDVAREYFVGEEQ